MTKRQFLASSAGLAIAGPCAAFAQQAAALRRDAPASGNRRVPNRKAKTTKLFKAPPGFPNALAVTSEGVWIGEQKLSGAQAKAYNLPEPKTLTENAWLLDWNGKVLRTVTTPSRNTSGMAVGGGYVWMVANAPPQGVFQVDMNSRLVSHRQIPLGPPNDGGGSHGAKALVEPPRFEQVLHARALRHLPNSDHSPPGRNMMTSSIVTPSAICQVLGEYS